VQHPINRPVLQPMMLAFLMIGGVLAALRDTEHGGPLVEAGAVVSLGCFVMLFALYWLGWLLREHELWRNEQRTDGQRVND
jgi:membrane protein DedA with SNARE-associated domain